MGFFPCFVNYSNNNTKIAGSRTSMLVGCLFFYGVSTLLWLFKAEISHFDKSL